jgi:hypothetical protein
MRKPNLGQGVRGLLEAPRLGILEAGPGVRRAYVHFFA